MTVWNLNGGHKFSALVNALGFQSRLENRGRFASQRNELQSRFRALKLGGLYGMSITSNTQIELGAVVLVGREYLIYNSR